MKIIQYSQHIWGVGHFFRSLEISKALEGHEIVLVTGGERVEMPLPVHVRECRLPGIMSGENPKQLVAVEKGVSLGRIRQERERNLRELYLREAPDVLLIEFYPFGRNAFRFELDPLLEKIRKKELPKSLVACSLRDILVEKAHLHLYEQRVTRKLNRFFDALLVHADAAVVRLDETFGRTGKIRIPVVYTGFVASRPAPYARSRIRKENGIGDSDSLIVASAGGGKAGAPLLRSVVKAFRRMQQRKCHLHVFSGPYIDGSEYEQLAAFADERTCISRFTSDFPSYLAASDLSVSMAGYNTCMNILSTGVRSLVWPFSYDQEQGIRAQRLAGLGAVQILSDSDLAPDRLGDLMAENLSRGKPASYRVNLDGAFCTAKWLMERVGA